MPIEQTNQDITLNQTPNQSDELDDGSSKLNLFLVFAHDTSKVHRGGWFDLVVHVPTRFIAQMVANKEFERESVTSVQIVNRFSGVVEWQKTK